LTRNNLGVSCGLKEPTFNSKQFRFCRSTQINPVSKSALELCGADALKTAQLQNGQVLAEWIKMSIAQFFDGEF
jgi:hypothetical protein